MDHLTQEDYFKKALQNLAAEVTLDDKLVAAREFEVSKMTIERYLKGYAPNHDLAASIIICLKSRIKERLQKVQDALSS